ncbi:hypothetical protein T11_17602 [Trichinella zimbabwensis]|uniref:Uncharacterized protein n=1 Tax=Trichinella zimbabwensis TaxID=268475 RepID=A0A0V1GVF4_9BILA|nr:hypothetical protein T11_10874 [Trichinella zimbabwensis]KRZ02376.1 hypothetical protein T11_17602 [Trichinella zimbabwensis]
MQINKRSVICHAVSGNRVILNSIAKRTKRSSKYSRKFDISGNAYNVYVVDCGCRVSSDCVCEHPSEIGILDALLQLLIVSFISCFSACKFAEYSHSKSTCPMCFPITSVDANACITCIVFLLTIISILHLTSFDSESSDFEGINP